MRKGQEREGEDIRHEMSKQRLNKMTGYTEKWPINENLKKKTQPTHKHTKPYDRVRITKWRQESLMKTQKSEETLQSEQYYNNVLIHWKLMRQQKYLHCTGKEELKKD